MNKMTSIQHMQNYTRSRKNMRSCIGWPPRNLLLKSAKLDERTSSAKLDEMLSIQKSASNRTKLGYDFSSSSIASASTAIFVPLANNVKFENNDVKTELASENLDKGKSILGAPPKQYKKEAKNPRAKMVNS